jgi:hypothetical protein
VPDSELPQVHMEAAHIIPFSLNKFDETKDLVIRVVCIVVVYLP